MPPDASGSLISPMVVALRRQLEDDGAAVDAVDRFWWEVRERGTPLIEPIPGEDDHVLVTFLWHEERRPSGQTPLHTVVVLSGFNGFGDFHTHQMERLAGTDVWYRSYRVRTDVRTRYWLSPSDALLSFFDHDRERWVKRFNALCQQRILIPDPLNRHPFPENGEPAVSCITLPDAAPQPWLAAREGVPAGQVTHRRIRSAILGNERDVWVYTPSTPSTPSGFGRGATAESESYPLLVHFDGKQYVDSMAAPTTLDNLIAAGEVPPLVAVFVDNVRRSQELGGSPPFVDFLTEELLPWVREHSGATAVTADPARTVIAGSSMGGLAATFAAVRRPDVFGNVLSQSGAYNWKPDGESSWEWLIHEIERTPTLPVRFWLTVGRFEAVPQFGPRPEEDGPTFVGANRHLRDVLWAKGCDVHHTEFAGSHDSIWWRGMLAEGLVTLLGPGWEQPA
jgi:enterochelin esterase-like enzyme